MRFIKCLKRSKIIGNKRTKKKMRNGYDDDSIFFSIPF